MKLFVIFLTITFASIGQAAPSAILQCKVQQIHDKGLYENINDFSFQEYPHLKIYKNNDGAFSISIGALTYADEYDASSVVYKKLNNSNAQWSIFFEDKNKSEQPDVIINLQKINSTHSLAQVQYLEGNSMQNLGIFSCTL